MFLTIGATTTNPEVSRFLITLDDQFRCVVELARKFGYLIGARVLPAFKFSCFLEFSGSSLAKQQKENDTNFPTERWPDG